MKDKPDKLFYKGRTDAKGNPLERFGVVPARDLDAADVARLDAKTIKAITEPRGRRPALYQVSKPTARDAGADPPKPNTPDKPTETTPPPPKAPDKPADTGRKE